MTKLEVACFNEESALLAIQEGVDRIELCEDYSLGGVTPNIETLKKLKEKSTTPVYVMVRPRGGDFHYTEEEFQIMVEDLTRLKEAGADGFVFGLLTEDHQIEIEKTQKLVTLAGGLPCTFHRAFDRVEDKQQALEQIISCGCTTVLTSGGEHPAMQGLEVLKALKTQAKDRITILVGGGVRSNNVGELKLNFDFVHSACIRPNTEEIDIDELKAIQKILSE